MNQASDSSSNHDSQSYNRKAEDSLRQDPNLREPTRKIKEGVRELGQQGRQIAEEQQAMLRERFEQGLESASRYTDDSVNQLKRYMKQKPLQSLAAAAGAGFLLGLCMRGRGRA